MMRPCDFCGVSYEAKRPSSRFCGVVCRNRNAKHPVKKTLPSTIVLDPTAPSLAGATERTLVDVSRLDTILGQQALALARMIADPATTGAAVASLSKELRAVMTEALRGAYSAADPVDELRRRREFKHAG